MLFNSRVLFIQLTEAGKWVTPQIVVTEVVDKRLEKIFISLRGRFYKPQQPFEK